MYQDGKIGEIESYQIGNFIHSKKIKKFQRSGKWVTIGVDPIRELIEDYLEVPKKQKYSKKANKDK